MKKTPIVIIPPIAMITAIHMMNDAQILTKMKKMRERIMAAAAERASTIQAVLIS